MNLQSEDFVLFFPGVVLADRDTGNVLLDPLLLEKRLDSGESDIPLIGADVRG